MTLWQHDSWRICSEGERLYLYRNLQRWEVWQRTDGSWCFPRCAPAYVQVAWTGVAR